MYAQFNCHIRRISPTFSDDCLQDKGLSWAGSGAKRQQPEAVRRRQKFFKDRLGYPENSKHFKTQIFTYVKLLIYIICTIIMPPSTLLFTHKDDWGEKFCKSAIFKRSLKSWRCTSRYQVQYMLKFWVHSVSWFCNKKSSSNLSWIHYAV